MSNKEQLIADRAISLQAAARAYTRTMADLIYEDSHRWSERPCGTCRAIGSLIGEPFGCYRYANERAVQRKVRVQPERDQK